MTTLTEVIQRIQKEMERDFRLIAWKDKDDNLFHSIAQYTNDATWHNYLEGTGHSLEEALNNLDDAIAECMDGIAALRGGA